MSLDPQLQIFMEQAGVPAMVIRYGGMIHVFMHLSSIVPRADQALSEAIEALRTAFVV